MVAGAAPRGVGAPGHRRRRGLRGMAVASPVCAARRCFGIATDPAHPIRLFAGWGDHRGLLRGRGGGLPAAGSAVWHATAGLVAGGIEGLVVTVALAGLLHFRTDPAV